MLKRIKRAKSKRYVPNIWYVYPSDSSLKDYINEVSDNNNSAKLKIIKNNKEKAKFVDVST